MMKIPMMLGVMVGCLAGLSPVQGGGSVAYTDVEPLLPKPVAQHLEESLEISDVGGAVRLGRIFKNLGGRRMGPYEFEATSKLTPDAKFKLTIHTSGEWLDADGNPMVDGEPEDASGLRESFHSYEIQSVATAVEPGKEEPTAVSGESAVERASRIFSETERDSLQVTRAPFESEQGLVGTITHARNAKGAVRKLMLDVATDAQRGFEAQVFYGPEQEPVFVLWSEEQSRPDPKTPGVMIQSVTEYRFYCAPDSTIAKAQMKSYEGADEAQLLKNRDQAPNRPARLADAFEQREFLKNLNNIQGDHRNMLGYKVEDLADAMQQALAKP